MIDSADDDELIQMMNEAGVAFPAEDALMGSHGLAMLYAALRLRGPESRFLRKTL